MLIFINPINGLKLFQLIFQILNLTTYWYIMKTLGGLGYKCLFTERLAQSINYPFFLSIFEFYKEIEQFQVVKRANESLEIRYIPGSNIDKSILDHLKNEMYKKVNEVFPFKFTFVNGIKPSQSGKPQIVVKE